MTEDSLDLLVQDWASLPQEGMSLSFALREDVNLNAEILFLGEALGEEEADQGRAFIGKAGKRLNDVLWQAELARPEISIANVIPRRPLDSLGGNRTPTKEEVKANSSFAKRLVALHHNLRVVVLLGGVPFFWKTGKEKITENRGREFQEDGIWYVPTFHPAYVLRSPSEKIWLDQDVRWAVSLLRGDVLDVQTLNFPFYDTETGLEDLFQTWAASRVSYLDIEAGAEPPVSATWHWDPRVQIIMFSLGWVEGGEYRTAVVEVNSSTEPKIRLLFERYIPEYMGGHYCLLYDIPLLRSKGFPVAAKRGVLDSFLLAKLNDENRGLSVKDLAKQHLRAINHTPYRTEGEEEKWQRDWIRWSALTQEQREERIRYSGADSFLGIQVLEKEVEQAKKFPKFRKLYWDLLVPATYGIIEMEETGLCINREKAKDLESTIGDRVEESKQVLLSLLPDDSWRRVLKPKSRKVRIKNEKGKTIEVKEEEVQFSNTAINFRSYQQIGKILFGIFGLPQIKKSQKSANDSTDEEVLLKLQGSARGQALDFVTNLLDYREASKAYGTYIEPTLKGVSESCDGRLHGRLSMYPVSWRLNSNEPNIQNFPGAKARINMRQMVQPPEGYVFVGGDFNALEVRGIADASGDPLLCSLLNRGEDLHLYNAVQFFRRPPGTTRDKQNRELEMLRQAAKLQFFASSYGAWEFKIASEMMKEFRRAGITTQDVLRFLGLRGADPEGEGGPYLVLSKEWRGWLKSTYRGIVHWWGEVERKISESGVFVTKFGFHRNLPDIFSDDKKIRAEAVRQAINIGPQNLSVMTQVAASELRRIRDRVDSRIRLWQNGHDALEWLCPKDLAEGWAEVVKVVMEDTSIYEEFGVRFRVPIVAEVSIGGEWN